MSNEQSNVVTKVIDVRHKAPDQAIHELMQAAKDGFAVTKIATRFNHTHVYLETNAKQVSTKQVSTSDAVGEANAKQVSETSSKQVSKAVDESTKETVVEKEEAKSETVKPAAKKATAKTTTKKVEAEAKDSE